MNTATLTTESGHTWTTSFSGNLWDAQKYFLGNFFQVGTFDETAPNEGFSHERVIRLRFTDNDGTEAVLEHL